MTIKYFTTLLIISFISFTMGLVWITSPRDSWISDTTNVKFIKQEAKNYENENDVELIDSYLEKDSLKLQKKDSILEANRTNP